MRARRRAASCTSSCGRWCSPTSWFADWLIRTALGLDELAALDDTLEDAAHAEARRAARV